MKIASRNDDRLVICSDAKWILSDKPCAATAQRCARSHTYSVHRAQDSPKALSEKHFGLVLKIDLGECKEPEEVILTEREAEKSAQKLLEG
jgi:hypothetical protein